ncbi:MAG: phage tail tape measure protein [Burkholderiales bacterium]|nr:phage tail tape measure protein [Burkholderiales bacterium]
MADDLRLRVIMEMANKASAPLRNIEKSSIDAAKALKAARETLKKLNEQQRTVDGFTKQQAALRESSNRLQVLEQNLKQLRNTQGASTQQIHKAEKALTQQTIVYERNRDAALKLRQQLTSLGITKVSEAQRRLKTDTVAATQAIAAQTARLKEMSVQQGKLRQLNRNHAQEMIRTGMLAATGIGAQAAGRRVARPVLSAVQAFAQQESASSQLANSLRLADGSVSAEFEKINELSMRLGDRLPGTTADFIDMMTMLRRQGLSAQSILGGTGEAAAFLAVQLKMPAVQAAEFAAKMQDATRTTERDMLGLMDLIQRTFFLGVDSNNMLQGFTKLSPVLDTLKKQGLDAANSLAPMLVMMDQSGLVGEAAGNGIRKVIQAGLDAKKLGKANDLLAGGGAGFQLNFVNEKGQFAGIDTLFAQLQKLKGIQNDVQRTSVIKALFGDDAETLQVLNTLMDKGLGGYNEIVGKLQAQADLRTRVEAELGTISNLWESTTGTFTNVMAALGQTVAPEVKALTTWLGDVGGATRAWIAEHPVLVGWIVKITAVIAGLLFGLGTLALTMAGIMGYFFVMRFIMGLLGLKFNLWAAAIRVVGTALTWLRGVMLFVAANPVVLAIAAIVLAVAAAAFLIYRYWGPITTFFANIWATIKAGLSALWESFKLFGGMLMDGLVGGITSRLAAVKTAIVGVAESTVGWFKDKLGIRSPSRVFMQSGQFLGEGAALGIQRSTALVRNASVGMAAAAAIGIASAGPSIDQRPPLTTGQRAQAVAQGDTITIQVNAAPGMDPQAIARAVSAELDKRDRLKAARRRSALGDVN